LSAPWRSTGSGSLDRGFECGALLIGICAHMVHIVCI
jgi:hypothetical protein